jgi:hypothetical protein
MVTDQQARRLWKLMKSQETLANAAAKAGMDEKTARKYRDLRRLPSEVKAEHTWRTRPDPFAEVWDEVKAKLDVNAGLEAKTLFVEDPDQGGSAAPLPGPICRRPITYTAAAGEDLACAGRAAEGGVFPSGAPSRRTVRVRFQPHGRPRGDDPAHPLRAYDLPLCVALLELGDGDDLLLRKLREPERRPSPVPGTCGRTRSSSWAVRLGHTAPIGCRRRCIRPTIRRSSPAATVRS